MKTLFLDSWQGIGLSHKPKLEQPLSIALLGYILYGSKKSSNHKIVIGDLMQRHNLEVFHGLSQNKALKLAKDKGKWLEDNLQQILQDKNLRNVEVQKFSDFSYEMQDLTNQVNSIIQSDEKLKHKFHSLIPQRFKSNLTQKEIEKISNYSLEEISMALYLGKIRISHPKQKPVDEITQTLSKEYGLGKINHFYPLPLEIEPTSGMGIEPYSSHGSNKRLLLTDTKQEFNNKINSIPKENIKNVLESYREIFEKDITNPNFYDDIISQDTPNEKTIFYELASKAVCASVALASIAMMAINTPSTPAPPCNQPTEWYNKYGLLGNDLHFAKCFGGRP